MTQLVGSVTDVALVSAIAQLHGELGEPYGETELGYRVEPNSLMGPHLHPLFFLAILGASTQGYTLGIPMGKKENGGRLHRLRGHVGINEGFERDAGCTIGDRRLGIGVRWTMAKMALSETPKWHGCKKSQRRLRDSAGSKVAAGHDPRRELVTLGNMVKQELEMNSTCNVFFGNQQNDSKRSNSVMGPLLLRPLVVFFWPSWGPQHRGTLWGYQRA